MKNLALFMTDVKKNIAVDSTVRATKFRHHCQYTVKECKIGFTLLTSILPFATILIDIRLT
jgi:hypothetical protein